MREKTKKGSKSFGSKKERHTKVHEVSVVRLKDEKGHFKKEAIVCVIGECELPADQCGV